MIHTLTLNFPHGTTIEVAQKIAQNAEGLSGFGISGGGYKMLFNPFMVDEKDPNQEELKFDESHAEFNLEYERKKVP
jgi:hypothetical protein